VTRYTVDGNERTFLLTATAFGSEPHKESLATYLDITDRKQAEEALKQRTQELEDFANVVSHDLRNPLNVASGHLDLLAEKHESSHIDEIWNAHERMQELIENILMLARQGKTIDDTEPVTLGDCVRESWATVETADATLNVETMGTVDADESRLRQLFGNLIRNAVEHGGDDVTITVGDLESGFYVADDGPGFRQLNESRCSKRAIQAPRPGPASDSLLCEKSSMRMAGRLMSPRAGQAVRASKSRVSNPVPRNKRLCCCSSILQPNVGRDWLSC